MDITNAGDTIVLTNISTDERKDILALAANRPVPPRLLTRKEVAEILRCHVKTVERHAKAGLIPQIKIGRRQVRYPASAVFMLAGGRITSQTAMGATGSEAKGSLEQTTETEAQG